MAPELIKTIDEVQENIPVSMTSTFSKVSSFLRSAEHGYVWAIIGDAQFNALKTYFDSETKNDKVLNLAINFCQKITSNIGYYLAIPILNVNVSGSGIQIFSSTDTKSAFQWQVEDLKDALIEIGFSGIEELLSHMEMNPDKFGPYFESDQYKYQQTFLIRSATDFNRCYDIAGSRYVFQCLLVIMRRLESQTVAKLFGTDFYAELKTQDPTGKRKILVEEYLKPGLALLTAAKAFVERVITLQNGKVAFNFRGNYNNMKESQAASNDQVKSTNDQLTADGNQFLQDGLQYIRDNPTDFPGFVVPDVRRRYKFKNDPSKGIFGV